MASEDNGSETLSQADVQNFFDTKLQGLMRKAAAKSLCAGPAVAMMAVWMI